MFFLQVLEVLLHYLGHDDHNVVTASLETLGQLLRTPPPQILPILTKVGGIPCSTVHETGTKQRSDSKLCLYYDAYFSNRGI